MASLDDFYEVYDKPAIGSITVGFSGIDPGKLPPPPEIADVDPSTIPHEQLKGLLGGNNSGHYHLTDYQLEKLNDYPSYDTLKDSIKHETLPDLQGGRSGEHYHLTEDEKGKLNEYPDYNDLADDISEKITVYHERMPDLLGGDYTDGHYHLTAEELENLQDLIFEFIPDGGGDVIIPTVTPSHELLNGLYGGNTGGHYHLTNDEWRKLRKLIAVLFPDGADEPVFPNPPDNPDDPEHGGTDWTGLPTGTPPNWVIKNMPSNYVCNANIHRMYYGVLPEARTVNTLTPGLIVRMAKTSDSVMYFMRTTDLETWKLQQDLGASLGTRIDDCMYVDAGTNNTNRHRVYIMANASEKTQVRYLYGTASSSYVNTTNFGGVTSFTACCYSPQLDIQLFVSMYGTAVRMNANKLMNQSSNISTGLSSVNPGCAEWLPKQQLFCVAGPQGTSTSATGAAGTWSTHTSAPKNLQDLTYREDLGVLLAWREEDRKFYVSADGINWEARHTLPSTEQISKIAAVDYNPDLEWYCAIGGTSKYAYFSKDLEHWVATTVSNGAAIPMGSVIWMANTKKYVLMPTSGMYFYTFSPSDWRDA